MATNTRLATHTQEILDENPTPLKADIFALQTKLSNIPEIKTQMKEFQDTMNTMSKMFREWVTQKDPVTHLDRHQAETSFSEFNHIPSFFQNSHGYSSRDMPRGPKLDMHKFDGNGSIIWVLQMEQFFNLHHINHGIEQLQVAVLYLDTERWWWWQWHKQCVGGKLVWTIFSKSLCARFDQESNFLGRLTNLQQSKTIKEFITAFEKLAIRTHELAK